jgi:hypothetical protein
MVARIKRVNHLAGTLNYNEQKVKEGVAECIHAVNYPKDLERLNFYDKLHRLQHQAALNERVRANSVHITLNFADSDQLERDKLKSIADSYMQQIGFGDQPYLVYEHKDAGHQHIHIVTTNIRADGSKIEMNNIGRNQSEKARKRIELIYGLTKAEDQKLKQQQNFQGNPLKVQYGKSGTKQSISNVLGYVTRHYKFTSLGEFNAILRLYNVVADPGAKDSRLRQHKGLLYRALDEHGNKIGAPIKASAFWHKPTLKNLEKLYPKNEGLREKDKAHVKVVIDWSLTGGKITLQELKEKLQKERIELVVQRAEDGRAYGVIFVDLQSKSAFKGSHLGKQYSAKGLEGRCLVAGEMKAAKLQKRRESDRFQMPSVAVERPGAAQWFQTNTLEDQGYSYHESLWEALLKPIPEQEGIPYELTAKYKKKKKKGPRPSH